MDNQVLELLQKMDSRLEGIETRLDGIDKRLDSMDERLDGIDKRLDSMDERLDSMDERLDNMEERLDRIETRQEEDHQILKALEHSAEVAKSERDNMTHSIARLEGKVENISSELYKLEIVTSSNWNDILKMKAAKQ